MRPEPSFATEFAALHRELTRFNTAKLVVMAAVAIWVVLGTPGLSSVISAPPSPGSPALERSTHFANCDAARAAGAAPIAAGQPGYRPELDGDGDGEACEPVTGRL